jgi:hypothetical protein
MKSNLLFVISISHFKAIVKGQGSGGLSVINPFESRRLMDSAASRVFLRNLLSIVSWGGKL